MAKKSKIAKSERQKLIASRYNERRAELRKILKNPEATWEEKQDAYKQFAKMPTDGNPNRIRNRCQLTGRPRGYFRKFQISRNLIRELGLQGEIPGLRKSSW